MSGIAIDVDLCVLALWFQSIWWDKLCCVWVELLPLSIFMPVNMAPHLVSRVENNFQIEVALDLPKDMQNHGHVTFMWCILKSGHE